MGYHVVDPVTVEPAPDRPCLVRRIGGTTGLENVGGNLYEAALGERSPPRYHYHSKQEAVFYIVAGDLHVETPDETNRAPAGQFSVAEPSSPLRAYNPDGARERVQGVAVGAPQVDAAHVPNPEP